jgi:hypothetical protein
VHDGRNALKRWNRWIAADAFISQFTAQTVGYELPNRTWVGYPGKGWERRAWRLCTGDHVINAFFESLEKLLNRIVKSRSHCCYEAHDDGLVPDAVPPRRCAPMAENRKSNVMEYSISHSATGL